MSFSLCLPPVYKLYLFVYLFTYKHILLFLTYVMLQRGLLFAKEVGIRDVVLEGDSIIVYNAICNYSPAPSSIAVVIHGTQDISREFRSVGYSLVRRQGNLPAHILAKYASSINDYVAWIEEDPCCIMQALVHDVNSIS